jgi:hypothetical protein
MPELFYVHFFRVYATVEHSQVSIKANLVIQGGSRFEIFICYPIVRAYRKLLPAIFRI